MVEGIIKTDIIFIYWRVTVNIFIPLVKSDRLREINSYKNKDYTFRLGENKFIYIRNIKVLLNKKEYFFQVRDNQAEQKFYISINNSCAYLSLIEIYNLLRELRDKIGSKRIRNILLGDRNKIIKLFYMGLQFDVKFFSKSIPKGKILLPESNIEINYEYLFLLIALIQDKSNYYWMLSDTTNNKYIDGVLRLFACLISTRDIKFLEKLGWYYDVINDKYYFSENISKVSITTKTIKGNIIKIKYYLTDIQFKNIMRIRNPSNFVDDGGTLR